MKHKYPNSFWIDLNEQHWNGKSVKTLSTENSFDRNTIYLNWKKLNLTWRNQNEANLLNIADLEINIERAKKISSTLKAKPRQPLIERFLQYVVPTNEKECWIWKGALRNGYGILNVNKYAEGAHRISYELYKDRIPSDLLIRHLCNNPPCVNPYHLEIGTQQDNMNDMVRSERSAKGENHSQASLTNEVVVKMRNMRETNGLSYQKIADMYNVDLKTAYKAILGITWSHI